IYSKRSSVNVALDSANRHLYVPERSIDSKSYKRKHFRKDNRWYRRGFNSTVFDKGVLPRHDKQIQYLPRYRSPLAEWSQREMTFGENDYIDIFTDGKLSPVQLCKGPQWLRATKTGDYRTVGRRMQQQAEELDEFMPSVKDSLIKRFSYLHKHMNKTIPVKKYKPNKKVIYS
ncbi:MAG: 39S ribosomal protein L51, mitochondrial, partial [Marteilia pararefringens]